jgi:hypothetical protein
MADFSDQQVEVRLLELENQGQADRRAELTGQRYLSLIHDEETGRGYVLQHGPDRMEGAEVPPDTEFWEYPTFEAAERTYLVMLREAEERDELVDEDSDEGIGDIEVDGAEVRDMYSAYDEDPLVRNPTGAPPGPEHGWGGGPATG